MVVVVVFCCCDYSILLVVEWHDQLHGGPTRGRLVVFVEALLGGIEWTWWPLASWLQYRTFWSARTRFSWLIIKSLAWFITGKHIMCLTKYIYNELNIECQSVKCHTILWVNVVVVDVALICRKNCRSFNVAPDIMSLSSYMSLAPD